jgi:hypothetical protein
MMRKEQLEEIKRDKHGLLLPGRMRLVSALVRKLAYFMLFRGKCN